MVTLKVPGDLIDRMAFLTPSVPYRSFWRRSRSQLHSFRQLKRRDSVQRFFQHCYSLHQRTIYLRFVLLLPHNHRDNRISKTHLNTGFRFTGNRNEFCRKLIGNTIRTNIECSIVINLCFCNCNPAFIVLLHKHWHSGH